MKQSNNVQSVNWQWLIITVQSLRVKYSIKCVNSQIKKFKSNKKIDYERTVTTLSINLMDGSNTSVILSGICNDHEL